MDNEWYFVIKLREKYQNLSVILVVKAIEGAENTASCVVTAKGVADGGGFLMALRCG
jgi:hypothetical protein